MIVLDISKGSLAGVQHKKQEAESSRPGIFDIKTLRQVNYVRGVAYRVSGFFGGHASTLTATSHLDRHSCTITGESSSQWQRSTARLRPLGKWLQGALLFRFLLQSLLGPIPRPHGLAVPWAPRSLCRSKNREIPMRGMEPLPRLLALAQLAPASFLRRAIYKYTETPRFVSGAVWCRTVPRCWLLVQCGQLRGPFLVLCGIQ